MGLMDEEVECEVGIGQKKRRNSPQQAPFSWNECVAIHWDDRRGTYLSKE